MVGKFVNNMANWTLKLGAGIVDKAYRFLVKPIASMMVTVFGFMSNMVMQPINFMKWMASSIMDRTLDLLHTIKEKTV